MRAKQRLSYGSLQTTNTQKNCLPRHFLEIKPGLAPQQQRHMNVHHTTCWRLHAEDSGRKHAQQRQQRLNNNTRSCSKSRNVRKWQWEIINTTLKLSAQLKYQLGLWGVTLFHLPSCYSCIVKRPAPPTETALARPRSVVIFESSQQRLVKSCEAISHNQRGWTG